MKKKSLIPLSFLIVLSLSLIHGQTENLSKEKKTSHWYNSPPNFVRPFMSPNAKKLPLIDVKGNVFINSNGDTILFRGLAIPDPDKLVGDGHWNKELFVKIKEMGTKLVRIPIHPIAWRERKPSNYLQLLDQAVEWCTELEMYIIIDWHSIGNLKMGLFQDQMYNTSITETLEFWRTIAGHFRGNNTIAFYEIFNEPTVFSGILGKITWEDWKKINEDIIALIRAYDNETIPLVAGLDWAYDLTPILISPIEAEKIAYVTHPYSNKRSQPWEPRWEENFGFATGKYPVFATEFGLGHPGEDTNDYGNRIVKFLESKGISWAMWVYDTQWMPNMLETWQDYKLNKFGEFVKKALNREITSN